MIQAIETRAETSIIKHPLRTTDTLETTGASLATLCGTKLATRTFATSARSKIDQNSETSMKTG